MINNEQYKYYCLYTFWFFKSIKIRIKSKEIKVAKRGLQYINYFYENKVIKKKQKLISVIIKNLQWHPSLLLKPAILYKKSLNSFNYTKKQFEILKKKKDLHQYFGIIKFNEDSIVQERMITLRDYFRKHTLEENKKIMSRLFTFIRKTWEAGFFEITFCFAANYGVTQKNDVKLIDVGEFCFEKEKLIEYVKNKEWLKKKHCLKLLGSKELEVFFKKEANEFFTAKNINKYW